MFEPFHERLRRAGCKITPARRAVLKIFEAEHAHLSPEDVLKRGRRIYPALGRATVYRTLDLLTGLGVLRPIYLGDSRPCFTRIAEGHHHLVCSRCERVTEFDGRGVKEIARRLSRKLDFDVQSHLLEFYGLCGKCRSAGKS
jgi:Fe2+ or Zn2+ uptake regulation protein